MTQHTVTVPLIEGLDLLPLHYASQKLTTEGSALMVDKVNWSEFLYRPYCRVAIGRSFTSLYIGFEVESEELRAVNGSNNSSVYQDSCVEFFMRSEGMAGYFNFEFNCIGTCLASECFSRSSNSFLSDDEMDQIKRLPSLGSRTFDLLEGVHRWSLLAVIPFRLMNLDAARLPSHILGNFYKCADKTPHRHYLSWNPIGAPKPDFHRPECFGILKF